MFREEFIKDLKDHVIHDSKDFEQMALELFRYQFQTNMVYQKYCKIFSINPSTVHQIPLLPISAFKTNKIVCNEAHSFYFQSSGTTSSATSKHYVNDLNWYKWIAKHLFERQYGKINSYQILALLPSYLENTHSSLIYMIDYFISSSAVTGSAFIDFDLNKLNQIKGAQNLIVFGVSYALLDWAEKAQVDLSGSIIMETGGMKGRRKEMQRLELHQILKQHFNVECIHSEYGMTELMSQMYSKGEGYFSIPNSMRVSIREINDPFQEVPPGKTGMIGIIDLANIDSCGFILTEDLGRIDTEGRLQVLGRLDHSDIRGCNLMYTEL